MPSAIASYLFVKRRGLGGGGRSKAILLSFVSLGRLAVVGLRASEHIADWFTECSFDVLVLSMDDVLDYFS